MAVYKPNITHGKCIAKLKLLSDQKYNNVNFSLNSLILLINEIGQKVIDFAKRKFSKYLANGALRLMIATPGQTNSTPLTRL